MTSWHLLYRFQQGAGAGGRRLVLLLVMGTPANSSVLLIDDDELSRAVLQLHLEAAGYEVTEAENGSTAVSLLADGSASAKDFAVILCDLQMPGLSGPELATELRRNAKSAQLLIAMSGSEPAQERIRGYDRFMLKPFTMEELADVLESPVGARAKITAETAPCTPVLEERAFIQLSSMLSPVQLQEIFELCFSELAKYLRRMQQAVEAGNTDDLRASAHTLKGSFGMIGARELEAIAATIESGSTTPANQAASLGEISPAVTRLKRILSTRGVHCERDPSSGQETS